MKCLFQTFAQISISLSFCCWLLSCISQGPVRKTKTTQDILNGGDLIQGMATQVLEGWRNNKGRRGKSWGNQDINNIRKQLMPLRKRRQERWDSGPLGWSVRTLTQLVHKHPKGEWGFGITSVTERRGAYPLVPPWGEGRSMLKAGSPLLLTGLELRVQMQAHIHVYI